MNLIKISQPFETIKTGVENHLHLSCLRVYQSHRFRTGKNLGNQLLNHLKVLIILRFKSVQFDCRRLLLEVTCKMPKISRKPNICLIGNVNPPNFAKRLFTCVNALRRILAIGVFEHSYMNINFIEGKEFSPNSYEINP